MSSLNKTNRFKRAARMNLGMDQSERTDSSHATETTQANGDTGNAARQRIYQARVPWCLEFNWLQARASMPCLTPPNQWLVVYDHRRGSHRTQFIVVYIVDGGTFPVVQSTWPMQRRLRVDLFFSRRFLCFLFPLPASTRACDALLRRWSTTRASMRPRWLLPASTSSLARFAPSNQSHDVLRATVKSVPVESDRPD